VLFVIVYQISHLLFSLLLVLLSEERNDFGLVLPHLAPHPAALGSWRRLLFTRNAHDGREETARVHLVHDLEVCKIIAFVLSLRLAFRALRLGFSFLEDNCQSCVRKPLTGE
jgi:hypothetical protein